MLEPDQRELFLNALRPPKGYQFDRGIGTTFTLDLLTLLIAPLSLSLLDVSDSEAVLDAQVMLLEGLRHYAEHLTIFCQAGRIAIPPSDNYLYSYLEKMIVEVQAPQGGVFHPKVWLLRYLPENEEEPPLYRLLNLSRNLTFDKSWDLMLRLEGHLATHRKRAYAQNNPLGDFVQALPELAVHPVGPRILEDIALLQHEVRRVDFGLPEPFTGGPAFHPSGIPGYRGFRFDQSHYRALVVSPFLSDGLLQQVTEPGEGHILVSCADSIAALRPETQERFDKLYVLDDTRCGLEEEEEDQVEKVGEEVAGAKPEPLGLHAKLFVLEAGWDATWLVGSSNATDAAFKRRNVEMMVGLEGRKSKVGIDKILGQEDNDNALIQLLRPYTPRQVEVQVDHEQQLAEVLADRVRDWLIVSGLRLEVVRRDADRFDLLLHYTHREGAVPEGQWTVRCWPVNLRQEHGITFEGALPPSPLIFSNLSLLALTSFVAFEIVASVGDAKRMLSFVFNLPISGVPEDDRDVHLLRAIISDRAGFLRCLWLILSAEDGGPQPWMDWGGEGIERTRRSALGGMEMPLLEALLRALSRSPGKIDRIARLVEGLQRTPEGRDVLPQGFEPLWEAVIQIRSEMQWL
jgi:hypothetical protein